MKYRLHTNRFQGTDYILGTYRYRWVAWLRGVAYIMRAPNRAVFIDEVTYETTKES